MTKFKVGQIWKARGNHHWEIESANSKSAGSIYPIKVKHSESDLRVNLTSSGHMWESREGHPCDLVELVQDVPSRALNFWEAREAALAGKNVKRLSGEDTFTEYDSKDFLIRSMVPCEINGHWEIVEEEQEITTYHQVFSDGTVGSGSYPRLDHKGEKVRIAMIELTTDKNGKLIEARNVDTNK
jgi:hypothetical protein